VSLLDCEADGKSSFDEVCVSSLELLLSVSFTCFCLG
jgi:hypothetical protein